MPAPVSITHMHVHSLRLRNGAEALVARVLTVDGVPGFGFSLGPEAYPARDMAAWDALARSRRVPLYALFGKKQRERVEIESENPEGTQRLDPFEQESLETVRLRAPTDRPCFLVAPHAHPWELAYCSALAGILPGKVRIAVSEKTAFRSIPVSDAPGIDIDWSLEPGFGAIQWYPPKT
jgi:hypothetical protein